MLIFTLVLFGWIVGMVLLSYIRSRFNLGKGADTLWAGAIFFWPIMPVMLTIVGLASAIIWLMEYASELGKRGCKQ